MKLLQSNFEDVISRHSMGLSPHLIHILHYLTIKCEDCPPWKPMPTASCACGVGAIAGNICSKGWHLGHSHQDHDRRSEGFVIRKSCI